jgi:cyclophilin family peptidyl-prolyl cis-trans isomerase
MLNKYTLPAAVIIAATTTTQATEVAVCTDQGRFVIELADVQSPQHVENFLNYVDMAYYSGTVFHRAVGGFVVQGGGFDRQLRGRPTLPGVENESRNSLSNVRGTVAAARTADPHSATSQFFINLEDNRPLDAGADFGYTVFGRVKEGIQVVDQISRLPTGASGPFPSEVPTPLIAVSSIARLDAAALDALPAENRDAAIKQQITDAAAAENYPLALQSIEHYRAACGPPDPQIAVIEADAALRSGLRRRAIFVLEEFFSVTEASDDPSYQEAVALYRTAVPENAASAAQLVADCDAPMAPPIPDGGTATIDVMVAGQGAVRDFVAAGETYLECLSDVIDDEQRTGEQRNAAIAEHNRMVAGMEKIAADFNAQIRTFKERE